MNKQLVAVFIVAILAMGGGAWFFLKDSTEESDTVAQTTTDQTSDVADTTSTQLAKFTSENVALHASKDDCWTIISGKVYDITEYIPRHQGGDEILRACGKDGTSLFTSRKTDSGEEVGSGTPHSSGAGSQLDQFLVGDFTTETLTPISDPAASAAE